MHGFRWPVQGMVDSHQAEDTRLPSFDRSTHNTSLLSQVVGTRLGTSNRCVGLGRNEPPPPNCVLSLGVSADGYRPQGRGKHQSVCD